MSLCAHAVTLLAFGFLLQRAIVDAPPRESEVAMVFAPAPAPVDAATAAAPEVSEPPLVEPAKPPPTEPEPREESAAVALPLPAEDPARSPAPPEPRRQEVPVLKAPIPPVQHPAPRRMAAARSAVHEERPAVTSSQVAAAAPMAPLLPARPVAGMESDRPPAYPEIARRRGQQGRVVLQVTVSPEGLPVTVTVAESSNYPSLDAAAVSAVQRWRFVPASRGGTPVAAVAEIPVRFRLTD